MKQSMKVALLGSGKTGSYVSNLHQDTIAFNSKNKPSIEALKECDIIIVFLPGEVFMQYIPLLIESKLPVISGSTGAEYPSELTKDLEEQNLLWVKGNNFSLGMNIVKSMIENLSKGIQLYPECEYSIEETHHTKKLDAPSGTALSFKNWLNSEKEVDIISHREGDIIGEHIIEMQSSFESITLQHSAKDRSLFANGALWAASKAMNSKLTGLIDFDQLVANEIGL